MEERKQAMLRDIPNVETPSEFEAFKQNTAIMEQIVGEMKEIAQLPSEKPKDVQGLQRVEFPPEGGVLTYMDGFDHPYKGFPFHTFVDSIDTIKKIQRGVLSSFFHSMKARKKWQIALLVFVPWIFGDIVRAYLSSMHRMIMRYRLKSIRYCTSMRELHRAFTVEWHDESPDERDYRLMIRDIMCMFLEFDNAYRFRFQDVIVNLDKNALHENPAKEIIRLMELMSSREETQEVRDTWRLVKTFLPWYLRFNKHITKWFVGVLMQLDLEKMALSVEDKCYTDKRKDYKFGHMLWQEQTSTSKKD